MNKIFYSHTFISLGSISGSAMTGASTLGIYLTLFNFLIFSSSFFVNSFGFDAQIIMLSVTKDRFTSSFPNCMIFVSFSCQCNHWLGPLVQYSIQSGESQNSSLIPEI